MVHSHRNLPEDQEKAFALNAKLFVPKPLNPEQLVRLLSGD